MCTWHKQSHSETRRRLDFIFFFFFLRASVASRVAKLFTKPSWLMSCAQISKIDLWRVLFSSTLHLLRQFRTNVFLLCVECGISRFLGVRCSMKCCMLCKTRVFLVFISFFVHSEFLVGGPFCLFLCFSENSERCMHLFFVTPCSCFSSIYVWQCSSVHPTLVDCRRMRTVKCAVVFRPARGFE